MWIYSLRRILYAIPILIGVNIITFALFFGVNSPDDMARMHLGNKHVSTQAINTWKQTHGYDKPLFYNDNVKGISKISDTLFFTKSAQLFHFDFGQSDQGRDISYDISQRMWPSLALAVPTLILSMLVNICFAMFLVLFANTRIDALGVFICVVLMSVSGMFYVIFGQYLFGHMLKWAPISGYQASIDAWRFLLLPVIISVISSLGAGGRWYRSIILEQANKPFVLTARSKGLSQWYVMRKHILRNALIPIITGVVVIIPTLFMGSLIMESFFGIPGLGSYTIDAINAQDFSIVRAMVFLGTFLYIIGLILTDIAYVWADPRITLKE